MCNITVLSRIETDCNIRIISSTMQLHVVNLPVHSTSMDSRWVAFFSLSFQCWWKCLRNCSSVGRILNRFSSDSATVDNSLPFIANILLANTAALFGVLLVLAYNQPLLLIIFVPLAILYVAIQAGCYLLNGSPRLAASLVLCRTFYFCQIQWLDSSSLTSISAASKKVDLRSAKMSSPSDTLSCFDTAFKTLQCCLGSSTISDPTLPQRLTMDFCFRQSFEWLPPQGSHLTPDTIKEFEFVKWEAYLDSWFQLMPLYTWRMTDVSHLKIKL